MKLIIGLGNPGKQYEKTRHNTGFMAVDYLVDHFELDPFKESSKHKALITEGQIGQEKVILMKPLTYMNLSGQAVRSIVQFYKLQFPEVIVVYDDVDIVFGKLRIRQGGSAAGHKGIKSMIQELGGQDFVRIRLGIKSPSNFRGDLEDYVLGKLTDDQKVLLKENIEKLPQVLEVLLVEGVEKAMQKYN